ncbi:MAG: twin-arginine translocation signal domain-containing protein, partial [Verrucomicrobia bacterium]|nr:twin-arginine translocation signal domain-containing protein [Verrucomicrobiota bacterium]
MPEVHDCCGGSMPATPLLPRRQFLRTAAAAVTAGATSPLWMPSTLQASPKPSDTSETLAAQLYKSLSEEQRRAVCFAFDDPLRSQVDNNWLITGKSISAVLSADQQDLVQQIFRHLHAPEFADRAMAQMVHDSEGKGFNGGTSVALFGQPGSGQFEFVLTGRHCTRRCDGDSVAGAAFGGPIFYGHQAGERDREPADHPGNVFWY